MKASELTNKLKKAGCYFVKRCKEHDKWHSPITGKDIRIDRYPSKEVPKGTADQIMKDAGIK